MFYLKQIVVILTPDMKKAFKKIKFKHVALFVAALLVVFLIDRGVKEIILRYLSGPYVIFEDFFILKLMKNSGVAFSIGIPYLLQLLLFPILLIFGLYVVIKHLKFELLFVQIVAGCIAGGALSNFIDRILFHHVVDYISIGFYPVFNIADIAITVGIFLLAVFYGKIKRV